jgi:hypothetical protein
VAQKFSKTALPLKSLKLTEFPFKVCKVKSGAGISFLGGATPIALKISCWAKAEFATRKKNAVDENNKKKKILFMFVILSRVTL